MISHRKKETLESEKKYRLKPEVKEYRKKYLKIWKSYKNGEITFEQFNILKPQMRGEKSF